MYNNLQSTVIWLRGLSLSLFTAFSSSLLVPVVGKERRADSLCRGHRAFLKKDVQTASLLLPL